MGSRTYFGYGGYLGGYGARYGGFGFGPYYRGYGLGLYRPYYRSLYGGYGTQEKPSRSRLAATGP
jgi:hypothetical protein